MRIAWKDGELYCHISTKAGFDPVKTLYVCARARMRQVQSPHVLRRHPAGGKSQSRTGRYWCFPSCRTAGGRRTRAADGDLPRHARQLSDPKREKACTGAAAICGVGETLIYAVG